MKEKRYTLPEEQKDAAFAAEPAPAYHGNAAMTLPEDECAEEDIDWNKIPVGWHPANEEEAVARIEAIEAEYENGQYIDADEFERKKINGTGLSYEQQFVLPFISLEAEYKIFSNWNSIYNILLFFQAPHQIKIPYLQKIFHL